MAHLHCQNSNLTDQENAMATVVTEEPAKYAEATSDVCHLQIAYCGTHYHGWQAQKGVPTVQGEIQERLRILLQAPELELVGTSRTDAGVHALDQHASFYVPDRNTLEVSWLKTRLNRWLPADICIRRITIEGPEFDARFSARAKAYTYVIYTGEHPTPFEFPYLWHCPRELDIGQIREAAALLEGTHDFRVFSVNPRREVHSTVRTIFSIEVFQRDQRIYISVIGDGFLYKMVRSLAGYLVKVGADRDHMPEETTRVLEMPGRPSFVETAPAKGLFLAHVFFYADEWQTYEPTIPPHFLQL